MFHPQTNGALVIFEKVVKPVFLKNKAKIDAAVNKAKSKVGQFVPTNKVD